MEVFETGGWLALLRESVIEVGAAVGPVFKATVPCRFLAKQLEDATATAMLSRDWQGVPGFPWGAAWVPGALKEAGCDFAELYEVVGTPREGLVHT